MRLFYYLCTGISLPAHTTAERLCIASLIIINNSYQYKSRPCDGFFYTPSLPYVNCIKYPHKKWVKCRHDRNLPYLCTVKLINSNQQYTTATMSKENESIKNISLPNESIEYAEREAKRFGISFTKYICSLIDNQMHENSYNKGSRLIALSTEERNKILANYPNS